MTSIKDLLREHLVPDVDGLFRRDGASRWAEVDSDALNYFEVGDLWDHDDWDPDPHGLTEVAGVVVAPLPDGGSLTCGEGGLGSFGFFARRDARGDVVWAVMLTDSNPFVRIDVDGTPATFTNNLDRSLSIDLAHPYFAAD